MASLFFGAMAKNDSVVTEREGRIREEYNNKESENEFFYSGGSRRRSTRWADEHHDKQLSKLEQFLKNESTQKIGSISGGGDKMMMMDEYSERTGTVVSGIDSEIKKMFKAQKELQMELEAVGRKDNDDGRSEMGDVSERSIGVSESAQYMRALQMELEAAGQDFDAEQLWSNDMAVMTDTSEGTVDMLGISMGTVESAPYNLKSIREDFSERPEDDFSDRSSTPVNMMTQENNVVVEGEHQQIDGNNDASSSSSTGLSQQIYEGAKTIWGWFKDHEVLIIGPALHHTEGIANVVVGVCAAGTNLQEIDENLMKPNLKIIDDVVLNPVVDTVVGVILVPTSGLIQPILFHVLKPIDFLIKNEPENIADCVYDSTVGTSTKEY